jgi:aldehyde:ferredoxin oxidoreductase
VVIDPSGAHVQDGAGLWGLDTWQTRDELKTRVGPAAQALCIGPAGEQQVPFACIMSQGDHAAGRTGLGAVMGSKNVKALVVCNQEPERDSITPDVRKAVKDYVRAVSGSLEYRTLARYGGAGYVSWCDEKNILATRNYRQSRFEHIQSIDGRRLEAWKVRTRGCFRCPVRCKADLEMESGLFSGKKAVRPEFEPMVNLGSKCGLSDLDRLVFLDNLCSRLGMDVISSGSVLAFAMDLFENGILSTRDTDGLEIRWGDGQVMETLLQQIARREGFGGILALGVRRAAEIIGRGADERAPHVKGLELTAYSPENMFGTALGYAVSSRGGDFNTVYPSLEYTWPSDRAEKEFGTPLAVDPTSTKGKAGLVRRSTIVNCTLDCLGLCKVPLLSLVNGFDLVLETGLTNAVTGRGLEPEDLFLMGERVANLERLLNIRFGLRRDQETLPGMFQTFFYDDSGHRVDRLSSMVQEFYQVMGWDGRGYPLTSTLGRLGLSAGGDRVRADGETEYLN